MLQLSGLQTWARPPAEAALAFAGRYGITPTVTSVYRTLDAQRALRDRYERCLRQGKVGTPGPCRYPANRPGDSAHNYGMAWDSWVPDYLMPWWIAVRRFYGFVVPDSDAVHAEVPAWRQIVGLG